MPWSPSLIVDGETPGVSKINSVFTDGRTYINDLDRQAIRRSALTVHQTPTIIPSDDVQVVEHYDTQAHSYADATFGVSLRYSALGTHGGSSSTGVYTGDRTLIGHPDATGSNPPEARLTFNSGTGWLVGNNGSDRVQGILLAFNVYVANVTDANATVGVMACLQFKHSGSATWWTMPKTERWVSRDDHKIAPTSTSESLAYDIPIRSWLGADQVTAVGGDPTTDKVTGVRAMCSLFSGTAGSAVLNLGSFRLSGIPLLTSLVS